MIYLFCLNTFFYYFAHKNRLKIYISGYAKLFTNYFYFFLLNYIKCCVLLFIPVKYINKLIIKINLNN